MAKYGRAKKYDEKDGYWFSTENGTHIHVEEGQTPREAVDETFKRAKANNAQVDRENAEREKLYAQDEERWGKKEPQSYNGAKARRNPNFNEKEYGEFFDERGVLKEGKEDEYFEKVERNKVDKLKDVIEELDNRGVLKTYDEDEIINAIYENELDGELGDFEEYVGDALNEYLKEDESESETNDDAQRYLDKTWENPLKNREGWVRKENGRYDFGDDENYGSINNDGEVEETVTATRVRNGDHDRPQVKYFENVEDAIEWIEEEPSTKEQNENDSERARKIKEARDRLKGGRQFNLSDDDIEYILKALNKW